MQEGKIAKKDVEKLVIKAIEKYGTDVVILANIRHSAPNRFLIDDDVYLAVREYLALIERILKYGNKVPFDVFKDLLLGLYSYDQNIEVNKWFVVRSEGKYYVMYKSDLVSEMKITFVHRELEKGITIYRAMYTTEEQSIVRTKHREVAALVLTPPSWQSILHLFDTLRDMSIAHLFPPDEIEFYCNLLPDALRYRCPHSED